jgi:hypothetical protein
VPTALHLVKTGFYQDEDDEFQNLVPGVNFGLSDRRGLFLKVTRKILNNPFKFSTYISFFRMVQKSLTPKDKLFMGNQSLS